MGVGSCDGGPDTLGLSLGRLDGEAETEGLLEAWLGLAVLDGISEGWPLGGDEG